MIFQAAKDFISALYEHPYDVALWNAYSDWLEEQGSAKAALRIRNVYIPLLPTLVETNLGNVYKINLLKRVYKNKRCLGCTIKYVNTTETCGIALYYFLKDGKLITEKRPLWIPKNTLDFCYKYFPQKEYEKSETSSSENQEITV